MNLDCCGLVEMTLVCHDTLVHGLVSDFVIAGAILVLVGLGGYLIERRRDFPGGVRRFLVWYAFAWPFMLTVTYAAAYPRLHWLYFMAVIVMALGYIVQALTWRWGQSHPGKDSR